MKIQSNIHMEFHSVTYHTFRLMIMILFNKKIKLY